MNIIEPDVFYSDIVLGIVLFIIAYKVVSQNKCLSWCFSALGLSTFFGAFYHGLYNTTQILLGDVLWSGTMILYALSSFLFIHFALPRIISLPIVAISTFLFSLFTVLVNESFLYGLLLQAVAILALGYRIYKIKSLPSLYIYGAFVLITFLAVYIQQQKINFGLSYSHNTIFHIIQIPAIMLLYLSLKRVSNT